MNITPLRNDSGINRDIIDLDEIDARLRQALSTTKRDGNSKNKQGNIMTTNKVSPNATTTNTTTLIHVCPIIVL